jgi:GNAT superfamily N-acetyltransferase
MNKFKIEQLKDSGNPFFAEFWSIYSQSFPLNERRDYDQQVAVLNKPDYQLDIYLVENKLYGFISYWKSDELIFVEHLAIAPCFQRMGLGSALLKPFIERQTVPVILEIEPPAEEITYRRLRFYQSLGFVTNLHLHFQPPYHDGEHPLKLDILSYPQRISKECYDLFSHFQKCTLMD